MEKTNNQKQNNIKQQPEQGKGYLDAFQDAFHRIWENKFLWFWGIFLPSGFSMGLNFNYRTDDSDYSKFIKDNEKFSAGVQNFLESYWQWLLVGVALFIVIMIVFWILSAIARRGVIRVLDQLQNKEKPPVFKASDVWKEGSFHFIKIIKLDITLTLLIFAVFVAFAAPIGFMFITQRYIGGIFLTFVALLMFIPLVFLMTFIKNIGVIFISLAQTGTIRTIESAYNLTVKNVKEALKFLLLSFLLGLAKMVVTIGGVFIVGILTGVVALAIKLSMENFINPVSITFAGLLLLVFIVVLFFIHAFFALWQQDLWLWWTKKHGGVRVAETETETEKESPVLPVKETEPVVGTGS